MNFYLGIDFGTSGARAIVIDTEGIIQAEAQYPFELSAELTTLWQKALFALIEQIPQEIREKIKAIAINGTSSTVLLCNETGNPIAEPLMYNDGRGVEVMEKVKAIAPPNHTVISATSSFAKLLWLIQNSNFKLEKAYFLHQADWLAFLLHGCLGISDYHNALKLGYDVENLCYPDWLKNLPERHLLPKVLAPGTPIGEVTAEIANRFGLQQDCLVCTGTTDSIAAFLASGVQSPGEAVTSLGSTLVLKLLSHTRVDDTRYGIYSHRLPLIAKANLTPPAPLPYQGRGVSDTPLLAGKEQGWLWKMEEGKGMVSGTPLLAGEGQGERLTEDLWLVGGASNTGGAVLRQFFTNAELESFSRQIDADKESPLDYYPLVKAGDRFPINDPYLPPRLEPRPENPVEFLHGLLESIARIEAGGYQLLQQFGATQLTRVYTAGGGAKNLTWTKIRARHLQVPILPPRRGEAAYGTALLAMRGVNTN